MLVLVIFRDSRSFKTREQSVLLEALLLMLGTKKIGA